MVKAFISVLLLITFCAMSKRAVAGQGILSGREWHLWSDAGYSIVIGRIAGIKVDDRTGRCFAAFSPVATLAGSFDPSAKATLVVEFYVSSTTSSIHHPPAEQSLVMVVYSRDYEIVPDRDGFIVSAICEFMPSQSAMVSLTGLDDVCIAETLKKVQEARKNEDPNPHPKDREPTTKPS